MGAVSQQRLLAVAALLLALMQTAVVAKTYLVETSDGPAARPPPPFRQASSPFRKGPLLLNRKKSPFAPASSGSMDYSDMQPPPGGMPYSPPGGGVQRGPPFSPQSGAPGGGGMPSSVVPGGGMPGGGMPGGGMPGGVMPGGGMPGGGMPGGGGALPGAPRAPVGGLPSSSAPGGSAPSSSGGAPAGGAPGAGAPRAIAPSGAPPGSGAPGGGAPGAGAPGAGAPGAGAPRAGAPAGGAPGGGAPNGGKGCDNPNGLSGLYVPRTGNCKEPSQCDGAAICNKEQKCESKLCKKKADCEAITNYKAKCSIFPGLKQGFCDEEECEKDSDCAGLPGYACYQYRMCKPFYGPCLNSCDCLTNYGLIKGEGICYNEKCFCRTDGITDCRVNDTVKLPPPPPPPPPPPRTEEPPQAQGGRALTTPPPPPPPKQNGVCPKTDYLKLGKEGEPCRIHQACTPMSKLICVKAEGQEMGTCKKVGCSSDADCSGQTSLPSRCRGKFCSILPCDLQTAAGNCTAGYGCANDGQCRKALGKCTYDCDCGPCPGVQCFKGTCYCTNDYDICTSDVGMPPAAAPGYAAPAPKVQFVPQPPPGDHCKPVKCPEGWDATGVGCYKIGSTKLPFAKAVEECVTKQKGFLAEIQSLHENEELLDHIVKKNEVWIGGKKKDNLMTWLSGVSIAWEPPNWVKAGPGECLKIKDGVWTNCDCSEVLTPICEIQKLAEA